MILNDIINGGFECLSGLFVLDHCRQILKDRQVKGVSIRAVLFFTLWGVWNLYYYPSLNQWWSFAGGLMIVSANCWYVWLLFKFSQPTKNLVSVTLPNSHDFHIGQIIDFKTVLTEYMTYWEKLLGKTVVDRKGRIKNIKTFRGDAEAWVEILS